MVAAGGWGAERMGSYCLMGQVSPSWEFQLQDGVMVVMVPNNANALNANELYTQNSLVNFSMHFNIIYKFL